MTDPQPSPEAMEAIVDAVHAWFQEAPGTRTVSSQIDAGKLYVNLAHILDAFAAAAVARERERLAGFVDCPTDCNYANASGTCQRINDFCSHYVADCIRRGEKP